MNAAEYDQALAREQIVRANLEQRLGALMGENIALLVRLHEYEQRDAQATTQPEQEVTPHG